MTGVIWREPDSRTTPSRSEAVVPSGNSSSPNPAALRLREAKVKCPELVEGQISARYQSTEIHKIINTFKDV